jgi:hypothetical protein
MLHPISSNGLIDLEIQATGDTPIDDHPPKRTWASPWPRRSWAMASPGWEFSA